MCGINGIIYKNTNPHLAEIKKMNMAIRHRGPDDEGVYKFENILLGHQRLSILDLSLKGKQPMTNDGRFWIVYNGEIYNFKEIKNKLLKIGYKFYSQTDTEVILNAYKEWGVNSFIHFNGIFSKSPEGTLYSIVVTSFDILSNIASIQGVTEPITATFLFLIL